MRLLATTFSSLTAISVAITLFFFTYVSVLVSLRHGVAGQTSSGAITLGIGLFALFLGLIFAMPTARQKLIRGTFRWPGRFLFFLLMLCIFAFILAILSAETGPHLAAERFGILSQDQTLLAILVVFLCFFLAFILPGFAFAEPRRLRREAAASIEPDAQPDHFQRPESRASLLVESPVATQPSVKRAEHSRVLEWAFAIPGIIVFFLALYGALHAPFLASPDHSDWVVANTFPLLIGFGLIVLGAVAFSRPGNPKWIFRYKPIRVLFQIPFIIGLSFAILPAAEWGAPAVLAWSEDGPYDYLKVEVTGKGGQHNRKRCDYIGHIKWDHQETTLCSMSPDIWEELAPGQILQLRGWKTPYGFRYDGMRRVF